MNASPLLHVAPEDAPSQMALPESERDMKWARARGAAWSPGNGGMIIGEAASADERAELLSRFTGRPARLKAEKARDEIGPRPEWRLMAMAAIGEVISSGGMPVREIPKSPVAREDRTYLFSIPDAASPWATQNLDAAAQKAGFAIYRDDTASIPGMGRGLRYADARLVLPDALRAFAGDEARTARREYQLRRADMTGLVSRAAGTVISGVIEFAARMTGSASKDGPAEKPSRRTSFEMSK